MKDQLRRYTIIIAYAPNIGKDKVDLEIEKFQNLVKSSNGIIERSEYLGIKPLAYDIKKYSSAHYVQYYFKFHEDKHLEHNLSEINRKIGPSINQNTIRHMIIKLDNEDFNFDSLKEFKGFDNQMKI